MYWTNIFINYCLFPTLFPRYMKFFLFMFIYFSTRFYFSMNRIYFKNSQQEIMRKWVHLSDRSLVPRPRTHFCHGIAIPSTETRFKCVKKNWYLWSNIINIVSNNTTSQQIIFHVVYWEHICQSFLTDAIFTGDLVSALSLRQVFKYVYAVKCFANQWCKKFG